MSAEREQEAVEEWESPQAKSIAPDLEWYSDCPNSPWLLPADCSAKKPADWMLELEVLPDSW